MKIRHKKNLLHITASIVTATLAGFPVAPSFGQSVPFMPPAGSMIHITSHFDPPQMVGLKVNLKDPFNFDFIMDRGEQPMTDQVKKAEFNKIYLRARKLCHGNLPKF